AATDPGPHRIHGTSGGPRRPPDVSLSTRAIFRPGGPPGGRRHPASGGPPPAPRRAGDTELPAHAPTPPMKVWLTQTVLSPYRIELFRRLAEAPGVDFSLVLLSDRFKVRPQWKRDLSSLPFRVVVPWGFSLRTGPEKEFCVNPLLVFK